MKKPNNSILQQIVLLLCLILGFVACEEDFVDLQSGVISDDNATNFDIIKDSFSVIAYTENLNAVQSNNLPINSLGVYNDFYGSTTSSILTQLTPTSFSPDFGKNTKLDSVILTIPYSFNENGIDADGNLEYELDSVIGNQPIKLSLYESNFFLRAFDPNAGINDSQAYFSNKSLSSSEPIDESILMNTPISYSYRIREERYDDTDTLRISGESIILTNGESNNKEITARLTPAIRLELDSTYWRNKIIDTGLNEGSELNNANNFQDFFRGLYFKVEAIGNNESYSFLNLTNPSANISLFYTRDNDSTAIANGGDSTVQESYVLNFSPTRVNFFDYNNTFDINSGDPETGDERLYLKGGQGAVAKLKLFNGSAEEFNNFKRDYVEFDEDGNVLRSKRLINEANLVFYVDQNNPTMQNEDDYTQRIYVYDAKNNTVLSDYLLDGSSNDFPELSLLNHLEPISKVKRETDNDSIFRYKIRITEHLNNLLLRDSTNVELGIAPALNVNLERTSAQQEVQNSDNSEFFVPSSSVTTPRGVVLHGSNIPEGTEHFDKRLILEVFYTCLDEDCSSSE